MAYFYPLYVSKVGKKKHGNKWLDYIRPHLEYTQHLYAWEPHKQGLINSLAGESAEVCTKDVHQKVAFWI